MRPTLPPRGVKLKKPSHSYGRGTVRNRKEEEGEGEQLPHPGFSKKKEWPKDDLWLKNLPGFPNCRLCGSWRLG